jgi:uncharacterized protein YoxC
MKSINITENKVLYYINMSTVILLLILIFILLIFYQLFLAHALNTGFKTRIIEGVTNITVDSPTPSVDEIYTQVKILADDNRKNTTTIDILNQKVSALSDQVKGMLLSQQTALTKGIDNIGAGQ